MNTEKLRFEVSVAPSSQDASDSTPRRMAAGTMAPPMRSPVRRRAATVPPPIPEAALRHVATLPYASKPRGEQVPLGRAPSESDAVPQLASREGICSPGGSLARGSGTMFESQPYFSIDISMDVDMDFGMPSAETSAELRQLHLATALEAAAKQLENIDMSTVFSDEPGRELVDMVDRSTFQLAANNPDPLFVIDSVLKDLDDNQPS